jgi:hypothetical protein
MPDRTIKASYQDFVGIYENAMTEESCRTIIEHFNRVEKSKFTYNRQEEDHRASKIFKDSNNYSLSKTSVFYNEGIDEIISHNDLWIFNQFKDVLWACYSDYRDQYGSMSALQEHGISGTVKIQKTKPSEGYHVWHCENSTIVEGNRLLLAILYLNDVENGGETEFLYQKMRIKPETGKLILCPTGFTHTHRGNPPLDGEKFIMTTWLEFVK